MSDELNESHEATGESVPIPAKPGEPAASPEPIIPPPGLDAPLGNYIDPYGQPPEETPPAQAEPVATPAVSSPTEAAGPTEYYQGSAHPGQALASSVPVSTPAPTTALATTVAPQVVKSESVALAKTTTKGGLTRRPPTPPPPPSDDGDEEEEGMLRMSFMDHLEELRTRILRALMGFVVAFFVALTFTNPLWRFVSEPVSYTHLTLPTKRIV